MCWRCDSNRYPQHTFLEVLNTVFLNISNYLPHLELRNRSIQIVVTTNFVVISHVSIKRFDQLFIILQFFTALYITKKVRDILVWACLSCLFETSPVAVELKMGPGNSVCGVSMKMNGYGFFLSRSDLLLSCYAPFKTSALQPLWKLVNKILRPALRARLMIFDIQSRFNGEMACLTFGQMLYLIMRVTPLF